MFHHESNYYFLRNGVHFTNRQNGFWQQIFLVPRLQLRPAHSGSSRLSATGVNIRSCTPYETNASGENHVWKGRHHNDSLVEHRQSGFCVPRRDTSAILWVGLLYVPHVPVIDWRPALLSLPRTGRYFRTSFLVLLPKKHPIWKGFPHLRPCGDIIGRNNPQSPRRSEVEICLPCSSLPPCPPSTKNNRWVYERSKCHAC
jgi:hypothetical protein